MKQNAKCKKRTEFEGKKARRRHEKEWAPRDTYYYTWKENLAVFFLFFRVLLIFEYLCGAISPSYLSAVEERTGRTSVRARIELALSCEKSETQQATRRNVIKMNE